MHDKMKQYGKYEEMFQFHYILNSFYLPQPPLSTHQKKFWFWDCMNATFSIHKIMNISWWYQHLFILMLELMSFSQSVGWVYYIFCTLFTGAVFLFFFFFFFNSSFSISFYLLYALCLSISLFDGSSGDGGVACVCVCVCLTQVENVFHFLTSCKVVQNENETYISI